MAITDMARFVLAGALAGGERWSCSFVTSGATVGFQSELDNLVADVHDAITSSTLDAAFQDLNNTMTNIDTVTGYWYPVWPGPAEFVSELSGVVVTGTSSSVHPNQIACVATLLTGAAGRSRRGRIYLPATGVPLTNGELPEANCQEIADGVASFFTAINGPGGGTTVGVASAKLGAIAQVTQIRVDSRLDVQRRRANKQTIAFQKESAVDIG